MLKRYFFLLLFFTIGLSYGQTPIVTEKSFPTNFYSSDFKNIKKFKDKMIAYDGKIIEKKNSRNNTPFYKLKLGENNYLWTVLMFKNEENTVGDKVRVVGYLNKIVKKRKDEGYLNGEKYMVIALGLVDFKNENFLFVSSGYKQKQEWIEGKIPSQ